MPDKVLLEDLIVEMMLEDSEMLLEDCIPEILLEELHDEGDKYDCEGVKDASCVDHDGVIVVEETDGVRSFGNADEDGVGDRLWIADVWNDVAVIVAVSVIRCVDVIVSMAKDVDVIISMTRDAVWGGLYSPARTKILHHYINSLNHVTHFGTSVFKDIKIFELISKLLK